MPVEDIEWAVHDITVRSTNIGLYRNYYDGDHRLPYSTARWRDEFYEVFKTLRDNLCPRVVDIKADRIQLTALTNSEEGKTDPISEALSVIWQREELERRQGEIHKNALKDGDAFVIVWPDQDGLARWYVQRGDRMAAKYSSEPQGTLAKAAKLWPVTEDAKDNRTHWRLNLYYPDWTERYITKAEVAGNTNIPEKGEHWLEFTPDAPADDGDESDLPSFMLPNEYGIVPVFPFPNNADIGAYGRSELRDVIPIQDALNKSLANMLVAGEFSAYPQRYLLGVEVDVDEAGRPTGREQQSTADRILAIGNPNAKAGSFPATDLENFIKEQQSLRQEMATISGIPLHTLLLAGDFPSGEAAGAFERPLASATDDRIISFKGAYRNAASFSLRIENVEHDVSAIVPQFKDHRYKSPESMSDEWRVKKEMGIPDEQLWREMGYSEEQIAEFAQLKEERRVEMQAAFDAGTGGVNPEATEGTPAAPFVA